MADDNHNNIRDEQFWFTATAIGFNAFILSSKFEYVPRCVAILIASTISLYAIFLVILRSAKHAGKIEYKTKVEKSEKDKIWKDKLHETITHLITTFRHIPYVIFELSGSFFFVLIILVSWIAVLLKFLKPLTNSICQLNE